VKKKEQQALQGKRFADSCLLLKFRKVLL